MDASALDKMLHDLAERRVALSLWKTTTGYAVQISQRSGRVEAKIYSLDEIAPAVDDYLTMKPLPPVSWDAQVIAEVLKRALDKNFMLCFGADFRKTGKGKVFRCFASFGTVHGAEIIGNDATAVVLEATAQMPK